MALSGGGFDQIARAVSMLDGLGSKFSEIARSAAPYVADVVDEQFAAQTDANGNPWEAHAESTIARWGEHEILTLTGTMHAGAQVTSSGSEITVSIDHPMGVHQIGSANMPARPFVDDSGETPPAYEVAIRRAIVDVLGVDGE